MPIRPMNEVVQHLRRIVFLQDGAGLTDGQLLECYVQHREKAAFAALVRRHGLRVKGIFVRHISLCAHLNTMAFGSLCH